MFTVKKSTHTQTGEDIWVVEVGKYLSTEEFNDLRKKIGKLGGYYSRFAKGFIFKKEDPTEKLKSLEATTPAAASESTFEKKLDLPKLKATRRSPRKDVIIREIEAGKMEIAVRKGFDGMTDSTEFYEVNNESFTPAEDNDNIISRLEYAKGQSHWVYSANVGQSKELGYYIVFDDYYIRYKQEPKPVIEPPEEDKPEEIKGGLADGLSIQDLADKHGRSLEFMIEQLSAGIDVEFEHTNDQDKAAEIAMDHLFESPDYYIELAKMEKKLEAEKEEPLYKDITFNEFLILSITKSLKAPYRQKYIDQFGLADDLPTIKMDLYKKGLMMKNGGITAEGRELVKNITLEKYSSSTTNPYDKDVHSDIIATLKTLWEPAAVESEEDYDKEDEEMERQAFGYSFNFHEPNSEAGDLINELVFDGVSDIEKKEDFINGLSFSYKGNTYLIIDNSGEFKVDNVTRNKFIGHVYFKEPDSELKSVKDLADEIFEMIVNDEDENPNNIPVTENIPEEGIEPEVIEAEVIEEEPEQTGPRELTEDEKKELDKKSYRVFVVKKDGSKGIYADNLQFDESEILFKDQCVNPEAEIVTWDKEIYNEYGFITGHKAIKMEVFKPDDRKNPKAKFLDELSPMDLWVEYSGDGRFYRHFEFGAETSEKAREILDYGIKERLIERKDGTFDAIISVLNEGEAAKVDKVYKILFPIESQAIEDSGKDQDKVTKSPDDPDAAIEVKEPDNTEEKAVKIAGQDDVNKRIRDLINQKGMSRHLYNRSDLLLLTQYTGDTKTQEETKDGYLWDYYTPDEVVKVCWQLAYKYGFRASESRKILEPACGAGRFLRYAPDYAQVVGYEIDEMAYKISQLLYPKFKIINDSFESHFYIKSGLKNFNPKAVFETFNLIIGNPPYMYPYTSVYKEKEKKVYPFIQSLEQWFLIRSCDALEKNGLLIFVIPSTIVDNEGGYREFKDNMAKKANMLDLYRLPSGTFKNTDITTDIIVLQKR